MSWAPLSTICSKPTGCFIVVHADTFQLQVRLSVVDTGGVNSMLLGDDFPELWKKKKQRTGSLVSNLQRPKLLKRFVYKTTIF